jgi:hypothetical protein
MAELFIGITTWDDELWVARTLRALRETLNGVDVEIAAWDNGSRDGTVAALRREGVRTVSRRCSQGDALNFLLGMSTAPHTLLMHSDVILLERGWFTRLRAALSQAGAALISPEDTGLGPLLRGYREKPESSFMLFDTARVRQCMHPHWKKFFKNALRGRSVMLRYFDFYVEHVTHRMPETLAAHGQSWLKMTPLASPRRAEPWCPQAGDSWRAATYHTYGFGNFYTYDGIVTHYHNWYARNVATVAIHPDDPDADRPAFCAAYTRQFFADYDAGTLRIPEKM